jgi:hypothetical protein
MAGFIPASTEISLLHYNQDGTEPQVLLCTQEQSCGLDRVHKGPLSSDKVRRENTDPLATKVSITSHWSPFVMCLVYNNPKVRLIHIS